MDDLTTNQSFNDLFSKMDKDDEIEIGFVPRLSKLTLDKYITMLKYFSTLENVVTETTLNISYNYDFESLNNKRITIHGLDEINRLMNNVQIDDDHTHEKHIIYALWHREYSNGNEKVSMIDKKKSRDQMVDIDSLGIRVRKATETVLDKDHEINITFKERKYINFRYIQRASLIIEDNDKYILRVDLSYVKSSDKLSTLEKKSSNIELEIDITFKKNVAQTEKSKIIKLLTKTFTNVQRVLQKSNMVISREQQQQFIIGMNALLSPTKEVILRDLPGMQTQSAEISHIVDIIPNNYSVTDKADGDRYFMFITEGKIILISNTLDVKRIEDVPNIDAFNGTILDGEYIFNEEYQKFIFLAFDCLMYKGEDKRSEPLFVERLVFVKDVVTTLFGQKQTFTKYTGDFKFDKLEKHYTKDIKLQMKELNTNLSSSENSNIVMMKYFIFPQGAHPCEVFFYTSLMWNIYTKDSTIQCPYILDGIILTPLHQVYTRNLKETKFRIYKVKPAKFNSLDLYVEFARDAITHQIIDVYDDAESNAEALDLSTKQFEDSLESEDITIYKPKGKMYRIAYLHVGKIQGNIEYPVLFQEEHDHHFAYIYIEDGEARDTEGNIIQDKTVVEFTYTNDPLIKQGSRWNVLRTRYDKTESVNTFKRKYGNNNEIADKTWRSMIDGVDMTDIELLGNPVTYEAHHMKLRSLITSDVITRERRENSYYTMISNLAGGLKSFHNWIKSHLIFTYCGKKDVQNGINKLDLLDYGCGIGGDIGKFLHARLNSYVGFDIDENNIFSGSDGALSRYQDFKKKKGVIIFPATFFVADGGVLLNFKDQEKALGVVSEQTTKSLKTLFDGPNPKKYDIISSQFVIHYFFKNDVTLNNFVTNLATFSKPSAYVLFTTFDAEAAHASFENNSSTSYYTTKEGEKKIIFDVKKKYEGKLTDKTGQGIEVHLPVFDDGVYAMEYLVPPRLLVNKMKEKGFRLVDTDLFENIFNKHKKFFDIATASHDKNDNFHLKVKEYYNPKDQMNQACYPFTFMSRYYVFQKEDDLNTHNTGSKKFSKYKK